jgi:hypothetical protein
VFAWTIAYRDKVVGVFVRFRARFTKVFVIWLYNLPDHLLRLQKKLKVLLTIVKPIDEYSKRSDVPKLSRCVISFNIFRDFRVAKHLCKIASLS